MNYLYCLAAFLLTCVIIPPLIFICKKRGWFDPINARKLHTDKIPRLGSVAIVPIFFIISFVYLYNDTPNRLVHFVPLFTAGFFVFLLGLVDDFIELPPLAKFIFQCVCCIVPPLFGFTWSSFGPLPLGVFSLPVSFLWVLGLVNAYNLIDGIDALCSGLAFFTLTTYTMLFSYGGAPQLLPLILAGCTLGFLIYNKPKAKIFLGDGGSQFLGYMIAVLPLMCAKTIDANTFPIAVMISSIPILDTVAAIWRRTRERVSFLYPDKAHLHHKLLDMGYSNFGILFFLFIIQIGLCAGAIFLHLKLNKPQGFVIIIGGLFAMVIFFAIIHYTYRATRVYIPPPPPQHPNRKKKKPKKKLK